MILDKAKMAHDYAIEMLKRGDPERSIAFDAWTLADAMQAEADKRKPIPKLPALQQTFIDGVEQPRYAPSCDEWQPDWSQAPSSLITHWSMEGNGTCTWWVDEPCVDSETHFENPENPHSCCYSDAPSFNYIGNWQESLRKRP